MSKQSAGILLVRVGEHGEHDVEVLLAHPGGPYFANKDEGAWTLPKGEPEPGESLIDCAVRELEEEIGVRVDKAALQPLGEITQKGGKRVSAWACRFGGQLPTHASNTFEIEWPPRSGRRARFPEIDRAQFFSLAEARKKLNPAQRAFIDRLRLDP